MEKEKLSKKKLEKLRLEKEREKLEAFEEYKKQLDEDYIDLHSDEFMDFYEFFLGELEGKGLGGKFNGSYGKFVDFVVENSGHKDEFRERKIGEYLEEKSEDEEDDEDEDVGKYDFLYFKGGY